MTEKGKPKCFTIMPFTVRDVDLQRYTNDANHWDEVYRGLITPAVGAAGVDCERDDEDTTTRLITENIWRKIETADVVLCDLSSHNPNVYLELGWALRADKRFVLIKDDVTQFNFDLNQFYTYEYSHQLQPSSLQRSIPEMADVIRATLTDEERRYSIVGKLSLQLQAMKAAEEGNIEVSLLEELLSEVRSSRMARGPRLRLPRQAHLAFPHIRRQSDLATLLVGSTWRKQNDLEHIIFQDANIFHNNHAGHPAWRENSYSLGVDLGTMSLTWSIDGLSTPCEFNNQFSVFVELKNPHDGVWSIIATEPFTPPWGV